MQNSNERGRLQSAVLPDGDIVRLVAGLYCPCGRVLRCDPEPIGDGGIRLLCARCHGDVLIYELGRRVKLTAPAATLEGAAALASATSRAKAVIIAAADDSSISFTCSNADIAITATATEMVSSPGKLTVSADSFTTLASGFNPGAEVTISTTETAAIITCNESRSRLPAIPAADPPTVLALDFGTGSVEISGDACLQLLEPLAAASTERTPFYLCGIFLHTVGDDQVAVATDGMRLVRVAVPAAAFSASRDLILPSEAATVLRRLLRTKPKVVRLRRSKRLLTVTAPDFDFYTRLIDGTFPIYTGSSPSTRCAAPAATFCWMSLRILPRARRRQGLCRLAQTLVRADHANGSQIPPASPNAVTCSRAESLAALHRLSVVCNADPPPLVALSWRSEGRLCVVLARQPDDGSDAINAEATGAARIAVPLRQIVGLIGNFDCESLRLEAGAEGPLVIIGDAKLALIMRVGWNFEREVP